MPGDRSRSLRALPGSRLFIATGDGLAFGLIDVNELESRAFGVVGSVRGRTTVMQEAADWWAESSAGVDTPFPIQDHEPVAPPVKPAPRRSQQGAGVPGYGVLDRDKRNSTARMGEGT